jgi:POT family proton-dependent oligopeptide transporter
MVTLWFLSTAIGTALSGVLAGSYRPDDQTAYFGICGAVAVGLGLVLAVAAPAVRRLMSGAD